MDPAPSIAITASLESNVSTTSTSSSHSLRKRSNIDFEFGDILGEGSYSMVLYAVEAETKKEFAVKVLDKRHIIKENKVKYVSVEKQVLHKLNHPFIVKLYYTYQDTRSLYFVLEYCPNGDFLDFLKQRGRLSLEAAKFYMAEIILANILLDQDYHIKITDFGTAKIQNQEEQSDDLNRKASFVGTAEYCSPELLDDHTASEQSDVWALGCMLYQFLVGRPPFKGSNEYQTFQKILKLDYKFPDIDPIAIDLISKILVLAPNKRLDLEQVKKHDFFKEIDWNTLQQQTPPSSPTFKPFEQQMEEMRLEFDDFGVEFNE